jgi:hypothetical protein
MRFDYKRFTSPEGWTIHAGYHVGTDQYDIHIKFGDRFALPIQFGEPRIYPPPAFIGTETDFDKLRQDGFRVPDGMSFLRAALNAAWEMGLRPDGYEDTRESLEAISSHLEDMRTLAFASAKVTAPQRKREGR